MSPRAVFSLASLDPQVNILRIEEEITPLREKERAQTRCDLTPLRDPMTHFKLPAVNENVIGMVGTKLLEVLSAFEPAHRQLVAAGQDGYSLLIDDDGPEAHELPWEILCRANEYLALGRAPLLGRTVTLRQQPRVLERRWDGTLRIVAVLAATGVKPDGEVLTAADELRALLEALRVPGAPPFDVLVVSSDYDLGGSPADDVQQIVRQQRSSSVRFASTGDDGTSLIDLLKRVQPNILHFFCHGLSDADGEPRIELATRTDQLARNTRGSIPLEARDLVSILAAQPSL